MSQIKAIIGGLVLAAIMYACANQVPITGGEKDVIPPEAQVFTPENFSTNFEAKAVKIQFDEMVQLRNTSEILVSPYLKIAPKYSTSGKNLIIEFPEGLDDSVTYTIDFGKSLVDLNEGNPLENFKYSFSTYDQIDTLEVRGTVRDAFTKEPIAACLVGLYRTIDMAEALPLYITLTNDEGAYSLSGVRQGSYYVRAFDDANKDKLLQPNEFFGFRDKLVKVDTTLDSLDVLASINSGVNPIYSVDYKSNRFPIISVKQPLEEWELVYGTGQEIPGVVNFLKDSFFLADTLMNDLGIAIVGSVRDTIRFAPPVEKAGTPGRISLSAVASKCIGNRVLLKMSSAVKEVKWEGVSLWNDTVLLEGVEKKITFRGNMELVFERFEGLESITIKVDSGAVQSGLLTNTKWNTKVPLLKEDQLSTISFQIADSLNRGNHYLVYLEDKSGTILRYKSGPETNLEFKKIQAGEYFVRVVIDQNGDGIWNSVDQELLRLPETVLLFGPYRVEEGWDLLENVIELL